MEVTPARLCVIVREKSDPVAGQFVLLRELPEVRVYLGCLADAEGRPWDWIELWVQMAGAAVDGLAMHRDGLCNAVLDSDWQELTTTLLDLEPEGQFVTGWEATHPPPTLVDLSSFKAFVAADTTSGAACQLCVDDRLLQDAGLPAYTTSLVRYLVLPGGSSSAPARFIPVSANAPENASTLPLKSVLGDKASVASFNPHCGFVMARTLSPLAFEEYVDVLGGKAWPGLEVGRQPLPLSRAYRDLGAVDAVQQNAGYLFLERQGLSGRLLETFHLKIQALTEAFRLVRAYVRHLQLPLLNLTVDSFRVRLSDVGAGLPFLWSARISLVKPGQARALPVATGASRFFVRSGPAVGSIFQPEDIGVPWQGSATLRVRKIFAQERGETVVEGTLVTQERLSGSAHDLIWLRLPLGAGRVDLYGNVSTDEALARGEGRFRSVPQNLSESAAAALRASEGQALPRVPFEIIPLLSSPCDLFSLGVLAVRAFLVNEETTLAVALDEVLSLGKQLDAGYDPQVELASRIRTLFEQDKRWPESLGPHRLLSGQLSCEAAFALLPPDLWYLLVAAIVRLFPGVGRDSLCRGYGDVPEQALESVFNRPIAEFENLVLRSRSLIFLDWHHNREIHSVIQAQLSRLAG